MTCNRCYDPMENKKGPCVFGTTISAPDPSVREKEDGTMKGILFTQGGRLFKATTPEAKTILKSVIKGEKVELSDAKEIGPVIDLDALTVETATAAFLKIEVV